MKCPWVCVFVYSNVPECPQCPWVCICVYISVLCICVCVWVCIWYVYSYVLVCTHVHVCVCFIQRGLVWSYSRTWSGRALIPDNLLRVTSHLLLHVNAHSSVPCLLNNSICTVCMCACAGVCMYACVCACVCVPSPLHLASVPIFYFLSLPSVPIFLFSPPDRKSVV